MRLFDELTHVAMAGSGAQDPEHGVDDGAHTEAAGHEESAGHSHDEGDSHSHEGDTHDAHAGEHGGHEIDYLAPSHLFAHVQDAYHIELPQFLGLKCTDSHGHEASGINIPNITGYTKETPMIGTAEKPVFVGRLSKFMVLELVAAVLLTVVFVWLAKKIKSGDAPKGKLWNLLETFVVFIRDEVVRPSMGNKDADRFLPFLLTLFFFILTLNLFGMIPYLGSATGSMAVTCVFALATFVVVVGSGIKKMGVVGFLKAQVPGMDLPKPLALVLIPAIWLIEMFGLLVKHFVLAVRLFANMFAGHLVLAIFMAFIGAVSGTALFYAVTPLSCVAAVAISMLELFVAFLQAYVFTFLASLFIGSAQHAH